MEEKTNVMRILDKLKIEYKFYTFKTAQAVSAVEVAKILGKDEKKVFKTLVTVSKSMKYYVFMIPAKEELNLKKCAEAVGEKSVEMLKSSLLLSVSGYVHGGCSPIGMKKQFKTVLDSSALDCDTIIFSGGKIGFQIELNLNDLNVAVPITFYQLTL